MSERPNDPAVNKNKRSRGKRGGKKTKRVKQNHNTYNTGKSSNHKFSVSKVTETRWTALDMEWFGSKEEENLETKKKIPDPIQIQTVLEITNNEDDSDLAPLRHVWQAFSRKNQPRGNGHNFNKGFSSPIIWKPRPIQLQAWSILLPKTTTNDDGDNDDTSINMIGLSPTASGKTCAFGVPMVLAAWQSASSQKKKKEQSRLFGIILAPTRELAMQIAKQLEVLITCLPNFNFDTTTQVRALAVCGGDKLSTQDHIDLLTKKSPPGCHWLVSGTPGRFWDIIRTLQQEQQQQQSSSLLLDFHHPRHVVLDESDRLAGNSDLAQQVTSILEACLCPQSTSLAFFSATYPHKVQDQWETWMAMSPKSSALVRVDSVSMDATNRPERRKDAKMESSKDLDSMATDCPAPEPTEKANENKSDKDNGCNDDSDNDSDDEPIDSQPCESSGNMSDFLSKIPAHLVQTLHVCAEHKKPRKLIHTLDKIRAEEKQNKSRRKHLVIIFFGRIKALQYASKLLKKQSNHVCLELHSQLPQSVRTNNLQTFQAGKVTVLLATDIAARGVHVSNINFVINYDFPSNIEMYIHRCGRAGRNYEPSNDSNNNDNVMAPTVYSFFTRSLAPLAPDLVALLQASNAWVDPNLVALAKESPGAVNLEKTDDGDVMGMTEPSKEEVQSSSSPSALVSNELREFYQHHGVNVDRLADSSFPVSFSSSRFVRLNPRFDRNETLARLKVC